MYFVYMVRCKDNSLYTGWTTNLKRRVSEHNKGIGAKYTRAKKPVKLVFFEEYDTKSKAAKREYAIKQLYKYQKEKLVSNFSKK
ncbi:GIY-YIG nuclease family protein [Sporosalibacterium faouarense]|uniref:GIY-YIG nuclease family protein n=1 Tax=Sporosalibacterium faouarense TaxID=516123 RepID=UPI00141C5921|nr:GIY-YIG nuclease family protein [Sporosalibacterium faouarense]MTI49171.1 GIY-YIG nuclease family protein [Bacillota bacterium]